MADENLVIDGLELFELDTTVSRWLWFGRTRVAAPIYVNLP